MDDREIIGLYLARDEAALAETAKKYGRMVRSVAYGILKNEADSEECENDAYLSAWESIPPQRPASLGAYLGRIVRNAAIGRLEYYTAEKRSRSLETPLDELGDIASGAAAPEAELERAELSRLIEAYLRGKSRAKRVVFVRRYWYCDPIGKIAKDKGYSESKVKSMLMRMRNELKCYLERNGVNL